MLTDETTQYSQQKERFFDSHRLKQAKVFRTQNYLITHCCALRDPMIRLLSPIGGKSNELNSPHNSLYFVDCPQSRSKVLCLLSIELLSGVGSRLHRHRRSYYRDNGDKSAPWQGKKLVYKEPESIEVFILIQGISFFKFNIAWKAIIFK